MKKTSRKTWLLAGALTLSVMGHGIAKAAGEVKICVEGAYPPFSSLTPSGDIVGFDIDMANAMVKKMGKTAKLVKVDWDGIIPALLAKKCDAIVASMSITAERKKKIDFSEKYYGAPPIRFVGKKSSKLSDDESFLKTKVVGVQRATIAEDYMKKKFPTVKIKSYGTQDEALADLTAGRVDAVSADSVSFLAFLGGPAGKDYGYFGKDHYDSVILGDGAGVGVRKEDTALRDAFSKAVKDLRASGEYKKINDKYFDFDIYK